MENLGKKVGYLKGLMEGMDFSGDPSKGKLLDAMTDLLGNLADRVETIEELMDDLNDYVESIDDDLAELEGGNGAGFNYNDDEDYEDEFYDNMGDTEDQLHVLGGKADDAPDEEMETLAGSICPECKRMFFVGVNDPEDAKYDCPHCAKRVSPEPLTPENAPIARPIME
ncbi:MAG: hypothetical protein IJ466_04690 [Clostridia bacterium]|nr:hypothetical protein [Clostridia bacterium]